MSNVTREQIMEQITRSICRELTRDREEVTLESDLAEMGADSLNLTEIVLDMEEAFGFEMPDEEMKKVHVVGDLVRFAEGKLAIK